MMTRSLALATLLFASSSAFAQQPQTYTFSGLSLEDVRVLARGLDKLTGGDVEKLSARPVVSITGMTRDELNVIGRGLDELSRKETNSVFGRMQQQIVTEDQTAAKAASDAAADAEKQRHKAVEDEIDRRVHQREELVKPWQQSVE